MNAGANADVELTREIKESVWNFIFVNDFGRVGPVGKAADWCCVLG